MSRPFYDAALGMWVCLGIIGGKAVLFDCPSLMNALTIQSIVQNSDKHRLSFNECILLCGAFGRTFFVAKTYINCPPGK